MAITAPWAGAPVQGNVAGSNVTTITVNVAAAPNGEVCFIFLTLGDAETGTVNPPAGWTTLGEMSEGTSGGSSSRSVVYWKVKQSGDGNVVITGSGWTVTTKPQAVGVSWPGVDPITPVEQFTWGAAHTSGTAYVSGTATPTAGDRWAVTASSSRGSTASVAWTADAALTERVGVINNSTVFVGLEVADSNGAVTQASHTYTATGQTASHGLAALFYLIPAVRTALPFETTNWTATTTPLTISVPGALTGDQIVVVYGGDNGTGSGAVTAATASTTGGSTSAWTEPEEGLGTSNQAWLSSSTATVTADGTVTVTLSRTQSTGILWGGFALLLHGYGPMGNHIRGAPSSAETVNLAVAQGSAVMMLAIDWDSLTPVAFLPAGANEVERSSPGLPNVTVYAGYWLNQPAGTNAYGIGTSATTNLGIIAIEFFATSVAIPAALTVQPGGTWKRRFKHRQILATAPAVAAGAALPVDQTDSVGLADSAILDQTKVFTDSVGLIDGTALAVSPVLTDSAGLTDTSSVELSKLVAQTDSAGLTDSAVLDQSKAATDSTGLTDSAALTQSKVLTDSAGLTDTSLVESGKAITQTDSVGLTDSQAFSQTHVLSDSTGLTDAVSLTAAKVLTDSAGLTDAASVGLLRDLAATDSAGLTDATVLFRIAVLTDLVGLADATAFSQLHGFTDSAGLTDAATVTTVIPIPPFVPRPNGGITSRPPGGTTPRPSAGTITRAASGLVPRPSSGFTPRP